MLIGQELISTALQKNVCRTTARETSSLKVVWTVDRIAVGDVDGEDTSAVRRSSPEVVSWNHGRSVGHVGRRVVSSTVDCHATTACPAAHRHRDDRSRSLPALLHRYSPPFWPVLRNVIGVRVRVRVRPNVIDLLKREHPRILAETGAGYGKMAYKTCNISETAEDRAKVSNCIYI